jgi:hypothetical protein
MFALSSRKSRVINNNIDLFNEMFSINKNNGNVISFEDIRIKSLIKENTEIEKKLKGNNRFSIK